MKQVKSTTGKTTTTTTAKTTGGKTNSINFERCDYDTGSHLLRAQFKQGSNSITVSINEDVLTEIYNCNAVESDLVTTFKAHQPEISRALLAKIANKEWKVPNKEIILSVQDLRK